MNERLVALFLFFLLVVLVVFSKPVVAANEYLNDYPSHCSEGSWELYTELRGEDGKYIYLDGDGNPSNSYRGYDDDVNGTVGIRFRKDFGSSCTDPYKRMMIENMELKQELELLKLCGRYKELDLGESFKTVRKKCKDVNKKDD